MIYHLDTVSSTNDIARGAEYHDGDIIWADFQTAGRGQRGHSWESRKGENLTFSVVLEPHFLPVAEQFMLLEAVALSLSDFFMLQGVKSSIKWTNDLYVGDRKAVGILIEHTYSSSKLSRTIVGVGINVNQREFSKDIPNPISLSLLTGQKYKLEALLAEFDKCLKKRYTQLRQGEFELLQTDYNSILYRCDEKHLFATPDGVRFSGTIRGVKPTGDLIVEHEGGECRSYLFKEIEFVITP
ncbi:MAG: biotin--[Alistipes sp.]|nr:biotin--[acetyl-CoA-carboxylase] ligase [Alistipes sp.]